MIPSQDQKDSNILKDFIAMLILACVVLWFGVCVLGCESVCENPVVTCPIKGLITTELFIE